MEISKKGRKPCHVGMIEQFFMDEGELMTIGADGFVKVWDFESIDNADTTEEGQLFEMDPMYELKVRVYPCFWGHFVLWTMHTIMFTNLPCSLQQSLVWNI